MIKDDYLTTSRVVLRLVRRKEVKKGIGTSGIPFDFGFGTEFRRKGSNPDVACNAIFIVTPFSVPTDKQEALVIVVSILEHSSQDLPKRRLRVRWTRWKDSKLRRFITGNEVFRVIADLATKCVTSTSVLGPGSRTSRAHWHRTRHGIGRWINGHGVGSSILYPNLKGSTWSGHLANLSNDMMFQREHDRQERSLTGQDWLPSPSTLTLGLPL